MSSKKRATKDYTYYTKGIWIEKKQRAYQEWLTYVLSPANATSGSSLNSKRLVAKVRGCVAKVYHKDPQLQAAMLKVESSISNGRLRLLTDGGFLVNPRMKKKAAKILLGYDAFWLKLGLETVFRMTLSPKQKGASLVSGVDEDELQLKAQLTAFVEEQFFTVPELKKKIKKNVKRRSELMEELAAIVLKRFLLLVFLLDRTLTTAELPGCLPLLFDPSSKTKTSADLVRQFLRGSLFGEGDTVKQLEYMGYSLNYAQGVVNEFDYRPKDLANDFRDGIRSCKLAEILLGLPILSRANFNTASNAVKVYNVKLALTAFSSYDKNVALLKSRAFHPQDIVDGHGETTVGYLWNVALLFQIPRLVSVNALVFEILQVKIHARAQIVTTADNSKICLPTGYDMRLALMLTWVQTVVSQYGATAKNYRSSFADGSVLCFLICHYLPSYMQPDAVYIADTAEEIKEAISRVSSSYSDAEDEVEIDSDDEDMDLKQFGVYSGKGWMDKSTFKKHRAGILHNFESVFSVMRALGGIPQTISALDFEEQGPDETAVILYVSYMCARLLQVSREERAALTIQRMWKIHKGYADPIELIELEAEQKKSRAKRKPKERHMSHDSLFTAFEFHRQQYSASLGCSSPATVISGFDSSHYDFIEPKELEAVVRLQARVRGALVRRRFMKLKAAVLTLEKNQPLIRDRCHYIRTHLPARKAANTIKAHFLRHLYSHEFQQKRAAAVRIQSHWKRFKQQRRFNQMKESMEQIQAFKRAMQEREEASKAEQAAVSIQTSWRAAHCRRRFCQMKTATTVIQAAARGHQVRREIRSAHKAATVIQAMYRRHVARESFLTVAWSVVCIQKWIRMWRCKGAFDRARHAAVLIQAQYRMHLDRENFLEVQLSVPRIQAAYRMHVAKRRFAAAKAAAVVIQTEWRRFREQQYLARIKSATVLIQATTRMHQCRERFLEQKLAAMTIQQWYRAQTAKRDFWKFHAASVIQSAWRGFKQAQQFHATRQAAIIIQRAVRIHQKQQWLEDVESRLSTILMEFVSVMEHTHDVVKATIIIQAYARGYLARKHNVLKPTEIRDLAQKRLAVKKVMMGFRGYQLRKKEAERNAAVRVLQNWVPAINERCRFLKMRQAAIVIQRQWRARQARRERAAVVIQRAFRATKEKRRLRQFEKAAVKIQSIWKGHVARRRATKEIKKAVSRLRRAERKAQQDPSKTLAAKCKEAVQTVKNNINVEQTFMALASLEMGTMYSQRCCEDIVASDALIPLLRVMGKCNRSAEHQAAFGRGLVILKNLCKYHGLARKVFKATECLETLSERLQYYRECPAIFSDIIEVFRAMLKVPQHKDELANNAPVIKQWNSLWSLLARKVDTERKYIIKLEADKASDTSAKRATEKAFLASHQLVELGDLFDELAVAPADFATYAHQLQSWSEESKATKKKNRRSKSEIDFSYEDWRYEATEWKPKNMIAKEKITQLRASGLPRDSALLMGAQKSSYVPPKVQKKLKVLSSDAEADALARRVNVRLMSDYRRKRSGSVDPESVKTKKQGAAGSLQRTTSSKITRSFSMAPEPKAPRSTRKAAK